MTNFIFDNSADNQVCPSGDDEEEEEEGEEEEGEEGEEGEGEEEEESSERNVAPQSVGDLQDSAFKEWLQKEKVKFGYLYVLALVVRDFHK